MKQKVLIGLSWPYANGRLHIGHVASSLPADVLARYHRSIGNEVSFITGSDCFGTPILVQSIKENTTPTAVAGKYHQHHTADFKALGFTFDNYDATMSARHMKFVQEFHTQLYAGKYIFEKTAPQLYCEKCNKYLPDRYVEGTCPHCKKDAKGDSCDHCGKIIEPEELINPKCKLCGGTPSVKDTTQLYLKLSALQPQIQKFLDERKDKWTANAVGMTQRYLNEGLHDRAITRSIEWGVPVPKDGWDDKKIYIWAENVLGYLSASEQAFTLEKNSATGRALHYYVHAKDNIPFHSIILPGLIMANTKAKYHLPDIIVASEYVNLAGAKISKSKGNLITAEELYTAFDVDMIRYYFLRTTNDKKDTNFTFEDFVNIINGELVNNFGNLVNRTLSFVKTKFENKIPKAGKIVEFDTEEHEYEAHLLAGNVSRALQIAMDVVNAGNKYFADNKPWVTNDKKIIGDVVGIIKTATNLLAPFIPTACEKVKKWLETDTLPEIEILFKRLDIKEIKERFEI